MQERIKAVKSKIEELIGKGFLDEAKALLDKYEAKMPGDPDITSMRAVILIMEGSLDEAESVLREGLKKDSVQFDLLFNLAYIYELKGQFQKATDLYNKAMTDAKTEENRQNVNQAIERIKVSVSGIQAVDKQKLVFFVKAGMDSFLDDIVEGLSEEYFTRKIIVDDFSQIDKGMKWADVCWFEWCDELVIYGSKLGLAAIKPIVCRIHGYEVYSDMIHQVNWKNVDNLVIVAPHIRRIFEHEIKKSYNKKINISTIFCGVSLEKYPFNNKAKGYNLGYLGFINYKKNLPLTLDIFKKLHDKDKRYRLFIAGKFQDERTLSYINYFIKEYKLEDYIDFDGWQEYEQKVEWFRKINYMVISSIDEGLCYAAAEAMCSGIKPVLHNCEGIRDHYDKKYIFNSVDEAVEMIESEEYNSKEYREYILENYSAELQLKKIKRLLEEILHSSPLAGNRSDREKVKSKSVEVNKLNIIRKKSSCNSFNIDKPINSSTAEGLLAYANTCARQDNIFEAALYYAYINKTTGTDVERYVVGDSELQKAYRYITFNSNQSFIFLLKEANILECINLRNVLRFSSEFSENVFFLNVKVIDAEDCDGAKEERYPADDCIINGKCIEGATVYSPVCIIDKGNIVYENVTGALEYLVKQYRDKTNLKLIYSEDTLEIIGKNLRNSFKTVLQSTNEGYFCLSGYYEAGKEFARCYNVNVLETLSKSNKMFSVVVPTRNSPEYLKYTLMSCIDQSFDDYEILVSDNSTPGNNDTFEMVKSLNSEKIRYIRPSRELSLAQSFEYAYLKSEGEYIFSLGSDDALLLHSLDYLCKIADKYPEEDIIQWGKTFYRWPGYPENPDMFYIPYFPKKNDIPCSYYDSDDLVRQIMNYDADMFAMPMIYLNSAMHRRRIKKIIDVTGRFLDGSSQDIYTGFVNLALSEKILFTPVPFIIAASSVNSIGYHSNYKDIYIKGADDVQKENLRLYLEQPSQLPRYCRNIDTYNDTLRITEFMKIVDKQITSWDYSIINWKKYYEGYADSISSDDPNFKGKLNNIRDNIRRHKDIELEKWFAANYLENADYLGSKYSTSGSKGYQKGFIGDANSLVLDMSQFGVDNVYEAAKFFRNLFNI